MMSSSERNGSVGGWALPDLSAGVFRRDVPRLSREEELASHEAAAYERGVADGRRLAEEALADGVGAATGLLAEALDALASSAEARRQAADDDIAALALGVARHLVQREIAGDPAILADLVRRATDLLPLEQRIEIRLHPMDLATLERHAGLPAPRPGVDVQWIADTAVEPGGCLVLSPRRLVDGRVDEALVNIYDRLRQP